MVVSCEEKQRQSNVTEKCDHNWLMDKSIAYCQSTRIWTFCFVEGDGLYCLLCKKHYMKNPRNKSDIFADEPAKRFRKSTLTSHLKTDKHIGAQNAELLN